MKLKLIAENIFTARERIDKSNIGKLLGYNKPLRKIATGTFSNIFLHPTDQSKLIKVTCHKSDVQNTIRAQRLNSNNIVKLYSWEDGQSAKPLPTIKAWALQVEKIDGPPLKYPTDYFLRLGYMGSFEKAADWLKAGGSESQNKILQQYKADDTEKEKLAELFDALQSLSRIGIELSDFDQNIIDNGSRYVIIDLGY